MIYSTGVDIVDVRRIERAYDRFGNRFLHRLFSPEEINQLREKKSGMIMSLAGKFAAKEAVMKALGVFFENNVYLKDIEVLNKPSGMPFVRLPQRLQIKLTGKKILISISHEKKYAVATALITDEE